MRSDGPYRLDAHLLDWYVEFSLPGLARSVAEGQLFGFTGDVAGGGRTSRGGGAQAGVGGRRSIFESAGMGLGSDGTAPTAGAQATRGVVFLDEIADLDEELQPKLLAVLTGAPFYRVGGEGREEARYEFHGLALAATWRAMDRVRPDLRARLQDHVLRVPSLTERRDEVPDLCRALLKEIKSAHAKWLAALTGSGDGGQISGRRAPLGLDADRLRVEERATADFEADEDLLATLQGADWRNAGEMRGLAQVLRRVVRGIPVADALAQASLPVGEDDSVPRLGEALLDAMLSEPGVAGRRGVASALRVVESRARRELVELVRQDAGLRARLAQALDVTPAKLTEALADLYRARRSR
jgi:hypothetical protein